MHVVETEKPESCQSLRQAAGTETLRFTSFGFAVAESKQAVLASDLAKKFCRRDLRLRRL
jgi:hypothetical protein